MDDANMGFSSYIKLVEYRRTLSKNLAPMQSMSGLGLQLLCVLWAGPVATN